MNLEMLVFANEPGRNMWRVQRMGKIRTDTMRCGHSDFFTLHEDGTVTEGVDADAVLADKPQWEIDRDTIGDALYWEIKEHTDAFEKNSQWEAANKWHDAISVMMGRTKFKTKITTESAIKDWHQKAAMKAGNRRSKHSRKFLIS